MRQITFMIAILLLPLAASRAQTTRPALKLIPTPQKVERLVGHFVFASNMSIASDDQFAAQELIDEVATDLKLTLPSVKDANPTIRIERATGDQLRPDHYILSVTPTEIRIASHSSAGKFYGVQTLKQLIS